ncbi:MAG: hypothetical protein KF770_07995 [Anaerolineae bacterium]|nr:hypothetical protein [Anaerolineae bacterium]
MNEPSAPDQLKVRLETKSAADREAAWAALQQQIHTYLSRQGLNNVQLALAPEPPVRDPRSGKFRHVWMEQPGQTMTAHGLLTPSSSD